MFVKSAVIKVLLKVNKGDKFGDFSYCPLNRGCPLNPFAPGDFAEKRVLKLVEWFSGHFRAIKSKNLPQTTSWPPDPVAKYQLAKFGHAQKTKCRDSFWV